MCNLTYNKQKTQRFGGNLKERDNLEDLGVDDRNITQVS